MNNLKKQGKSLDDFDLITSNLPTDEITDQQKPKAKKGRPKIAKSEKVQKFVDNLKNTEDKSIEELSNKQKRNKEDNFFKKNEEKISSKKLGVNILVRSKNDNASFFILNSKLSYGYAHMITKTAKNGKGDLKTLYSQAVARVMKIQASHAAEFGYNVRSRANVSFEQFHGTYKTLFNLLRITNFTSYLTVDGDNKVNFLIRINSNNDDLKFIFTKKITLTDSLMTVIDKLNHLKISNIVKVDEIKINDFTLDDYTKLITVEQHNFDEIIASFIEDGKYSELY